ncbi:hypothetical protein [Sphingopyxis granuli]|uniref:C-type lysozyme inhibitor domain-containing protein n=1 Tax=Sphingopyxis granuli TaxID=267128 RepID=A0AA86L6K5_9SPHN|nr:hypothetical protein [Sphingopyxis granuli]AMG76525.1 Uncharacterized protein SGRAN_4199 [Sphingopyxis granuli]
MTSMSKGDGWARRIALSRCLVLLTVPLAGLLAGCSESDQADTSNMSANTTLPIQMPPAIVASHTYRCTGGNVLYVDFLADGTSINVKQRPSGPSLRLTAPSQGLTYVGDGMNLALNGKDIEIDEPKKPSRMCKRS